MRALLRLAALAAPLLAPAGCLPTESAADTDAALTTDRAEYVARYQRGEGSYRQYAFTLVARFHNRGDAPLYLDRCYPDSRTPIYGVPLADRGPRDGGPAEQSGFDGAWACVGHDRLIEVAPGATRVDTLTIVGPGSWDGRTGQPFGTLEGEFRLLYGVNSCSREWECRLPRELGLSTSFRVRVER